jgi:hypothetical protein
MVVDTPPKISDPSMPTKVVPVEVLPPLQAPPVLPRSVADGPPIHALSALILAAVDSLWAIFEWAPPLWIVAIPLCFLAVAVPTFLIQKYLKQDGNGRAVTFATLLGVLAAIPMPITGTAVGVSLLAWTGLGKLIGRTKSR